MIYCDASLVVAVLTSERHSVEARRWVGAQDEDRLVVSHWVEAEVASALAMKVRRGIMTVEERALVWSRWQQAFARRGSMTDVQAADFGRASQLVDAGRRGLRAADALHLAIAARLRSDMATLDDDLANAARAIGLDAPDIRAQA